MLELPPLLGPQPCDDCNDQWPYCNACNGTRKVSEDLVVVQVGKHHVSHTALHLLATLPQCSVAPHDDNVHGALWFKFDGGEGLLMPMEKRNLKTTKPTKRK